MLVQTLITDYFIICINNKMKQIEQKQSNSQTLITDYFEKKRKTIDDYDFITNKKNKVYGYNPETDSWHCLECGDDMGRNNPRQLCGKYFCRNL